MGGKRYRCLVLPFPKVVGDRVMVKHPAPSGHRSTADLPSEVWQRLDRILERFEDAWRRGEKPDLDAYLMQADGLSQRRALLVELVHEDLEYRLRAGESVRIEEYLQRYPE